jgi:hypothetical protein
MRSHAISSKVSRPDLTWLDFKKEYANEDTQNLEKQFSDYLVSYFQHFLKAQYPDPITIARDSVIEMMAKVIRQSPDHNLQMKQRETIKGFESEEPHDEMSYLGVKLECSMPSKCLHGVFQSSFLS